MNKFKVMVLLGACPFSITAGWTADEENWFVRTWNELTNPQPTLQFDETNAQQAIMTVSTSQPSHTATNLSHNPYSNVTPYYSNPYAYPSNPYDGSLTANDINSFYSNTGQTYELAQLPQYNLSHSSHPADPIESFSPYTYPGYETLSQQISMTSKSTNSAGLMFTNSHAQASQTFHNVRPPEHTRYTSKEDVARMKKDKSCTNQLLDLIYWGIVPNCFTLKDIVNNPHIRTVLQTAPDHRLWQIIWELDAFSDFPGLAKTIQQYAQNGLATAQHMLALMYYKGISVAEKNVKTAQKYWNLSADQGFAFAQLWLGHLHYEGKDATQDYDEAARLFALAADQGIFNCKLNLGCCYEQGYGVEQSIDQALKFYLSANFDQSASYITPILKPVRISLPEENTFSDEIFFENSEEILTLLLSNYYPDAMDVSFYPENQQVQQVELRSWIYNELIETVSPLIQSLKTVSPGFMLNCLKENKTITRAQTNPAPHFERSLTLKSTVYISLGEENGILTESMCNTINFLRNVMKKIKTLTNLDSKNYHKNNDLTVL